MAGGKRRSKLDDPGIREFVVGNLAAGKSQTEVAKVVKVDQSRLSKYANREDIRHEIEEQRLRLLDLVPDAISNVHALIRGFKDLQPGQSKERSLGYEASKDLLKASGLYPSPVTSQTLVQIYNSDKPDVDSPETMALLSKFLGLPESESIPEPESLIDVEDEQTP